MPYTGFKIYDNTEIKTIPLETPGDLNRALTEGFIRYIKAVGVKYRNYNKVIGMLKTIGSIYRKATIPIIFGSEEIKDINWNVNDYVRAYFYTMIITYLEKHGDEFDTREDITGAVTCAIFELYRRKVSSYEEECIQRNGDVYPTC